MGSLDDKITRLSADQRREVEHFIDFLLQRGTSEGFLPENSSLLETSGTAPRNPIIMADEVHSPPPEPPRDPLPGRIHGMITKGAALRSGPPGKIPVCSSTGSIE
ncbi:MAG: DUF2281 domain-containing protein [Methanomicrobiales archaeon]|nr:DUF2281 domain-containing protein [Methanomicrobiales archaeon]